MKRTLKALILSLSMLASTSALATTEQYGTLLSGSFQPTKSFASLSVTGSGSVYNFTLNAFGLNSLFTKDAFIGVIAVDINAKLKPVISNVTGGSPVSIGNGKGPKGAFEFRFDLSGSMGTRLTDGESVSWTATFAKPVTFEGEQFALHVQGLTNAQGRSGWYVNSASPVPEPETLGMLLSGLGLIGFVASRKKKTNA